jgi:hypothetical protein
MVVGVMGTCVPGAGRGLFHDNSLPDRIGVVYVCVCERSIDVTSHAGVMP